MKAKKFKRIMTRSASTVIAFSMAASPVAVYASEVDQTQVNSIEETEKEETKNVPETENVKPNSTATSETKPATEESKPDAPQETPSTEKETSSTETSESTEETEGSSEDIKVPETPGSSEGNDNEPSDEKPGEETTDTENPEDKKDSADTETSGNEEVPPETESPEDTEKPSDAETPADEETPPETEIPENEKTDEGSDSEEKPSDEEILESEDNESVNEKGQEESENSSQNTSAGLTYQSADKYEVPVFLYDYFRFWTVEKNYSFAKTDINVFDDMEDNATVIGTLKEEDVAYILLTDANDEWAFIESGDVRGFVRTKDLYRDEEANKILVNYQKKAKAEELAEMDFTGHIGKATVDKSENKAFAYVRMTTQKVVVDKVYALPANKSVDIKEEKSDSSRTVGTIEKDGLAYVIADFEKDWVYVESGDVRGFVKKADIDFDETVQKAVKTKGEEAYQEAVKKVEPLENKALYYTVTSIKEGERCSDMGMHVVEFASQFVGNEYVWGGTSLTNGADCSGFVQSVFKHFGYELPRVASAQAQYGKKISLDEIVPGDLVFYSNADGVYHVMIYAGNGKTVEAKSSSMGIGSFNFDRKSSASWAVRVIPDNDHIEGKTGKLIKVPEKLGHVYTYMGWQCITDTSSNQYKLRKTYGMNFNDEGIGVINGRYVIATTTTFGNVGDQIDFYLDDGTILPCIIGDIKNQDDPGCTMWGHCNGTNMIEFVVDRDTWYTPSHANPGTESFHPELNQYVEKVINLGSVYEK